ncbi:papain-like cysteine protease family protein [Streptomyces sp. NPDC007205]|uniref:papain-like cysteine protease family protein n=1 Tax=Streptomyces sp. NPDC007205 TaxID=3154316 RepID=UPI0033C1D90B
MRALIAAVTATLGVALGLAIGTQAQAAVTGTLYGGQGKYSVINQRSQPSTSSTIVGRSRVGDRISMTCRTVGITVENDSRWVRSGSYYIADAFIAENTNDLPPCNGNPDPDTPTPPGTPTTGQKTVSIKMQKQVQSQWCWDASGLTIAKYWGFTGYDQHDFCQLAATGRWVNCNNQPATLDDMANGLDRMGIADSGDSISRASFSETTQQIKAGHPFAVRIGWRSGGGHMNVIYGYDSASRMIAVGDPWPDTQTYTWWAYDKYSSNNQFEWTHSRINIHN